MLERLAAVLFPAVLLAQPLLKFEVVSVKPTLHPRSPDGHSHSSIDTPSPGHFVAENTSLQGLIEFAYDVKGYQVSSSNWFNDERYSFDINAKAPSGDKPTEKQIRMMLQSLLIERFHLVMHWDTKVVSAFDLEVDHRGTKMLPTKDRSEGAGINSVGGDVTGVNVSMAEFADILSGYIKYPVFNKTALPGTFDFKLHYDPQDSGVGPSIFAALEAQLGLHLRASKETIKLLVVDHADRSPTPN